MITRSLKSVSWALVAAFIWHDLAWAVVEIKPQELPFIPKTHAPLVQFPESIAVIEDAYLGDGTQEIGVRKKKDSSISVCIELLKKNEVAAVMTAGNTGAAVAAATLKLGYSRS